MFPFIEVVGNSVQLLRCQLPYGKRVPLLDCLGPVRLPLLSTDLPDCQCKSSVFSLVKLGLPTNHQKQDRAVPADSLDHHGAAVTILLLVRIKTVWDHGKAIFRIDVVHTAQVGEGHILPLPYPSLTAVPEGLP